MKTRLGYFVSFVCFVASSLLLHATTIKLTDGRTFPDATILSQTPTTVLIRYAGGAAKVAKTLLPPKLLAQYPIDEKAAAAEAEEIAKGKAIYDARAKLAAEQQEKERQARAAETAKRREKLDKISAEVENARTKQEIADQLAADKAAAKLPEKILAAVRTRADRYFKTEYGSRSKLTFDIKYDFNPIHPVEGWKNTYEVVGVAWYQYYESVWGGSFAADKQWFAARIEVVNGIPKVLAFDQRLGPPL